MDNPQSQTEWNGGALTNMRIHNIRDELRMCAITKDLSTWLGLLVKMNHELYGFESDEEKKQIRKGLLELSEKVNNQIRIMRLPRAKIHGIPPDVIDALNDMEYTLDEIFHKSGLQTALKDDAGDSF